VTTFGQHVSPAVAEQLLTHTVELDGEVRRVAILVLDIRDYSTFASRTAPGEIVDYLNALFEPLVECVTRHHGIVNKFLGDGFMAVFGVPLPADRASSDAVTAALEMVERVEDLNLRGAVPTTRIGIGIHTGEVVTGNVGSASRKEYTIIGDAVNLAFRIEQLNKQVRSCVLVSDETYAALGAESHPAAMAAVPIAPLPVKGHAEQIQVYRLA
jgi:adenylate cyclase